MSTANLSAPASARVARGAVLASLALLLLGPLGARSGVLPPMFGFQLLLAAALPGLIGLLAGGVGLVATRGGRRPGRGWALLGVYFGLGLIAGGYLLARPAFGHPRINDITTDLERPPPLLAAAEAEENAGRDLAYPAHFAAQQRAAYPDLGSLQLVGTPEQVLDRAERLLPDLGLERVARHPERGLLEARATSSWFRFTDDVVLRAESGTAGQVRVDVRSKSRHGRGDLGVNAARVRRILAALR